jgi:NADPH:quinone reductase-like Zn-dependent oxidoreductase
MQAVVTRQYRDVDVLNIQEVKRPTIGEGEILVRVYACSVNPIDWKVRRGDFRILTGLRPPRILGGDYAGVVVEVGSGITAYQPGDEVWGFIDTFQRGTYAEFVAVKAQEIGPKPTNLSFVEAAALPTVGLTAYQALLHYGRMSETDHVLVNGSSGGVGLSAVQIAHVLGGRVTGVCSTRNLRTVMAMGADDIIDYTRQDLFNGGPDYDIFFDVVSNRSFAQARTKLKPSGIYVRTLPSLHSLVLGPFVNLVRAQKVKVFDCKASAQDLAALRQMVEVGSLVPVIENVYRLDQVRAAHRRSETGHVVGKLVLQVVQ